MSSLGGGLGADFLIMYEVLLTFYCLRAFGMESILFLAIQSERVESSYPKRYYLKFPTAWPFYWFRLYLSLNHHFLWVVLVPFASPRFPTMWFTILNSYSILFDPRSSDSLSESLRLSRSPSSWLFRIGFKGLLISISSESIYCSFFSYSVNSSTSVLYLLIWDPFVYSTLRCWVYMNFSYGNLYFSFYLSLYSSRMFFII